MTGYLGPNGSCKSTTMKMITGLIEMTDSEIFFQGERIQTDPIAYRQRMGYVPEEPHLYSHFTRLEYLTMVAQLRNLPERRAAERIDGLLHLFCLHSDRNVPISWYFDLLNTQWDLTDYARLSLIEFLSQADQSSAAIDGETPG